MNMVMLTKLIEGEYLQIHCVPVLPTVFVLAVVTFVLDIGF